MKYRTSPCRLKVHIHIEKRFKADVGTGELASLERDINAQSPDFEEYSNPVIWRRLPFPFVCRSLPNHRFAFSISPDSNGHNQFEWMGREGFPPLVHVVGQFKKDGISLSAALLHGTVGVGKSHLLAALAVWLRRQGKIVAYLPDCEEFAKSPIPYMVAALLCAFARQDETSRDKRDELRGLEEEDELIEWCWIQYEQGIYIYFLVDQLNAIEDQDGSMVLSAAQRERARGLLSSVSCHHFSFCSSDSLKQRYELRGRAQRAKIIVVRQQLTPVRPAHIQYCHC
jgi:hypothetical protein